MVRNWEGEPGSLAGYAGRPHTIQQGLPNRLGRNAPSTLANSHCPMQWQAPTSSSRPLAASMADLRTCRRNYQRCAFRANHGPGRPVKSGISPLLRQPRTRPHHRDHITDNQASPNQLFKDHTIDNQASPNQLFKESKWPANLPRPSTQTQLLQSHGSSSGSCSNPSRQSPRRISANAR